MLADSLSKAFGNADRMVSIMRTKATAMNLPGALAGANAGIDSQPDLGHAAEQYAHNRGWVFSCVRLVGQRVSGQSIHVARVKSAPSADKLLTKAMRSSLPFTMKSMADRLEPLETHAVLDLLADPWELGVAWSMIFATVASLELTGRSLWYVTGSKGRPTIFPVPTSWIEPTTPKDRSVWKIRAPNSAQTINLPGDRVCYFFYPSPSDPWGALSPLAAIAGAVNADEAIGQCHWRTFTQGQFPGVILTAGRLEAPPGIPQESMPRPNLTAEQRKQLIEAIRRVYSGVVKLGEPMILDGMIEKIEKLTLTPAELDFINSGKFTKSKILQGFGVSPILLGEVEGANRASATVADEIFCANKVNPLISLLSQSLTAWLGPMFAAKGEKLVIWIDEARAHDPELHSRNWNTALGRNVVTKNEYRRNVLNLPDIEGGDELPDSDGPAIDLDALKSIIAASDPYSPPAHKSNGQANRIVGQVAR